MKIRHNKKLTLGIAVLVLAGFIWGFGLQKETVAKAPTAVDSKANKTEMRSVEAPRTYRGADVPTGFGFDQTTAPPRDR